MIYDQVFSTRDVQNGALHYRIEVRMPGPSVYQQRHVWLAGNSPCPDVVHEGADEWIPSLKCCFDGVRKQVGAYEVSEMLPAVDWRGRILTK